ncbi:MAG: site-2 protease family protein [Bacteroidales bacterium]
MQDFDIIHSLKLLPGIIIGLTLHEFSHAWMAMKCGDYTSTEQGRLTLNPLKHIDLYGFIMLMILGFGWAKPVQFREENLRNPRRDVMKIAIAGPLSNAIIAIILSILLVIFLKVSPAGFLNRYTTLWEIFVYAIFINWGLFIFNLIPLPPLDGSHILFNPLRKHQRLYQVVYQYGTWILLGIILLSIITKIDLLPISPAIDFLGRGFLSLLGYTF